MALLWALGRATTPGHREQKTPRSRAPQPPAFRYPAIVLRPLLAVLSFASQLCAQQWAWSVVPSDPGPARWVAGVTAFDRARGCTVLVNGSDVWESRGTAWRLIASPPNTGGTGLAFAYDPGRQRCLWFGGGLFFGNQLSEWDGTGWRNVPTANAPTPRTNTAMAYDVARARMVLFGGWTQTGHPNDTWEFDGVNWQQVFPAAAPPGMSRHRMVYDVARGEVLLYGGQNPTVGLWRYDGTTWRAAPPGPPALFTPAMVYDDARARTVLVSSSSSAAPRISTWEWDGTAWSNPQPNGPMLGFAVNGVYDSVRGMVQIVASEGDGAATWGWDGASWHRGTPFGNLPALSGIAAAYHAPSGAALAFGGSSTGFGSGSGTQATYRRDRGGWRLLAPSNRPAARSHAALAQEASGDLLLMGGRHVGTEFGDSWRWNGSDWALVATPISPPARSHHAMVADRGRGRVVLFGGQTLLGGMFGDTWEWDGTAWTQVATTGPSPRVFASMTYDPMRGRTLLFGGGSATAFTDELWQWDGASWTPRVLPVRPTPRGGGVFTFDLRAGAAVLAGGFYYHILGSYVAVGETWLWDDVQWTPVAGTAPGYDPTAVGFYDEGLGSTIYSTPVPNLPARFATDYEFAFGSVAAATSFGIGCPGASGHPLLAAVGVPRSGNQRFAVWLTNARERAFTFVGFDWQATAIALGNGCQALLPGPVFTTAVTDGFGNAMVALPLPASPALHGLQLHGQAVTVDPTGALLGTAALTAGLRITLSS